MQNKHLMNSLPFLVNRMNIISLATDSKFNSRIFEIINHRLFPVLFFLFLTLIVNFVIVSNIDSRINNEWDIVHSSWYDGFIFTEHLELSREKIISGNFAIFTIDSNDFPILFTLFGTCILLLTPLTGVGAFNIIFLISFFLSGLFMFFLTNYLIKNRLIACFSGAMYVMSNYVFLQFLIGHGNQMQIQWIPLLLYFILKSFDTKNIFYAIMLGIVASVLLLSGVQYFAFMTIIFSCIFLVKYWKQINSLDTAKLLFIAGFVFILLSGIFIFFRINVVSITRTIQDISYKPWRLNSITELFSYNSVIQLKLILIPFFIYGLVKIILSKPKKYSFLLFGFLLSLIFAIGFIGRFSPYYFLYLFWPFVNKFRTPQRFFPFIHLFMILISAIGLKDFFSKKWIHKNLLYQILLLFLFLIIDIILSFIFSSFFRSQFPII